MFTEYLKLMITSKHTSSNDHMNKSKGILAVSTKLLLSNLNIENLVINHQTVRKKFNPQSYLIDQDDGKKR